MAKDSMQAVRDKAVKKAMGKDEDKEEKEEMPKAEMDEKGMDEEAKPAAAAGGLPEDVLSAMAALPPAALKQLEDEARRIRMEKEGGEGGDAMGGDMGGAPPPPMGGDMGGDMGGGMGGAPMPGM
jgi:hypothetical protein